MEIKSKFKIGYIVKNATLWNDNQNWWKLNDGSTYRWSDEELELVKKQTESLNINDAINSMKKGIDRLLFNNKIIIDNLTINEKWFKGNPIINRKEENKMIESINLINLYADKHEKMIKKEYNKKIDNIRDKSSIKKQYEEITQKCIDDLQKLYISQFSEEELEKVKETYEGLSCSGKEMQHKTSCCEFGYFIDSNFVNDEIEKLKLQCDNKIKELVENIKVIKAHVAIATTKEEVEEILTRYGIIDKKGKLVLD